MRRNMQDRLQAECFGREAKTFFFYAAAAVIVLLILGMADCGWGVRIFYRSASAFRAFEVEAMDIDLDRKSLELVNTWCILETGKEDALLALVWAGFARQFAGNLRTSFEGRNFASHGVVMKVTSNLVVISSTEPAHYFCILGFDGDDVSEYREVYSKKMATGE